MLLTRSRSIAIVARPVVTGSVVTRTVIARAIPAWSTRARAAVARCAGRRHLAGDDGAARCINLAVGADFGHNDVDLVTDSNHILGALHTIGSELRDVNESVASWCDLDEHTGRNDRLDWSAELLANLRFVGQAADLGDSLVGRFLTNTGD